MPEVASTRDEVVQAFALSPYQVTKTHRGFKVEYKVPKDLTVSQFLFKYSAWNQAVGIDIEFSRKDPTATVSAYHSHLSNATEDSTFGVNLSLKYPGFAKVAAQSVAAQHNPQALPEMLKITTEILEYNGWQWRLTLAPSMLISKVKWVFALIFFFIIAVFLLLKFTT